MKYIKALLFICLFISCKKGERDTIHLGDINSIYGGWEELTVKYEDTIIFNPCNKVNKSIILDKDSIKIEYGHDEIKYRILSKSFDKKENIYKFITSDNINLKCQIITSETSYWFIDKYRYIFTKEKFVNKYKVVDQPCQECWEEVLCNYPNLIPGYDIIITKKERNEYVDIVLNITLRNIQTNKVQSIIYISDTNVFSCKGTLYKNDIGIHNEYDIVVGDFNFDNKYDFAILFDNTVSLGTIFKYFIQDVSGSFILDEDFPVKLIPVEINKNKKTLTRKEILGCCKIAVYTIQLQPNDNWEIISSESIDINVEN